MLIHVHYTDNGFDYVNKTSLQKLIDTQKIVGFMRSSGWVDVEKDPIRKSLRRSESVPTSNDHHNILRVEYENHSYDYVADKQIDTLIEQQKIVKFKRNTGWVEVGVDPLRKSHREHTNGYPDEIKKRA